MNTSCIRSIKASYKIKLGSKRRIRGMSEYQEAERETEREARRETSRTGAAMALESGAGAAEEHSVRKARQVVSKRPRATTSQGKPSPKKAKKGSEAEAPARMPEVILPGAVEQEEEEEEGGEATPTLRLWGLLVEVLQSWRRESLQANSPWPKGLNSLKRRWRSLKLRSQEFQLGLELLRPMREGQRCNNLGFLVY